MSLKLGFLRRSIVAMSVAVPIVMGCVSPATHPRMASEPFGDVTGVVRDSTSGERVGAASLRIEGSRIESPSTDSGNFRLSHVPSGRHTLVIHRLGYVPRRLSVVVEPGGTTFISVSLKRPYACDIGCDESDIVTVLAPGAIAIPSFRSDTMTTGAGGERLAALVGTVVDSVTGLPLESGSVLVQPREPSDNRFGAYVDAHGGFVIGRIKPGAYRIVVRRIGWKQSGQDWDARAGEIKKVEFRLPPGRLEYNVIPYGGSTYETVTKARPGVASSTCLPVDSGGTDALDRYRWEDTADRAVGAKWRANLGLTRIPPDQISLVNDESLCRRALTAFKTEFRDQDEARGIDAVYVIRYGKDRFIIGNPHGPQAGEWRPEIVADGRFRTISLAGR
jgi:hypothetical protein